MSGYAKEKDANAIRREGYRRAVDLLHKSCGSAGFVASPAKRHNYNRVWARDTGVIGLAALLKGDEDLVEGCKRSLFTLAKNRGPHGEIPSNVDPETGRVSFGGTTGRVDADLWFVILVGEYWRHTGDDGFLERMLEPLEEIRFLLGAWEFNNRGLLYVPPTGDWADEYLQSGYVLYDQLLYLQALRVFCRVHEHRHSGPDHRLEEKTVRLKHLIQANYWFEEGEESCDDIYHEVLYAKGKKAAPQQGGSFWLPFFSPTGYGYRFDSLANALTSLLGVSQSGRNEAVFSHVREKVLGEGPALLPAFHPVITPKDEEWEDLKVTFSYKFKNEPNEYHNGGRWPMVTGFYAAALAQAGDMSSAESFAEGIHWANRTPIDGQEWSFPEFLHGEKGTAGGTAPLAWSAAGAIIAEKAIEGKPVFAIGAPERKIL